MGIPTTSLSTPLPSAEFGSAGQVRGKGRVPAIIGGGVVEELRRVYEERCRIVRSQEPGRKDSGLRGNLVEGEWELVLERWDQVSIEMEFEDANSSQYKLLQ